MRASCAETFTTRFSQAPPPSPAIPSRRPDIKRQERYSAWPILFASPPRREEGIPPVINTEFLFLFTSSKGKRTILRLYIYSFILCQPELFPDEKEVVSLLGQQLFPTKELKENFETWTERERETISIFEFDFVIIKYE